MRPTLAQISEYLCCPDDGGRFAGLRDRLRCNSCNRLFPLYENNVFDFLPTKPVAVDDLNASERYVKEYSLEFSRPFRLRDDARAWGAPENVPRIWSQHRERHAREVLQFLGSGYPPSKGVFCDLSAGSGYCTFEASREYDFVFHCDLSLDSLGYAIAKAKRLRIENIVFIRADYFQLPFRGTISRLTCLDTLIRGSRHELKLLESIGRALSPDGAAVLDFHNWWHNPVRRLGLRPDNFKGNRSYTRRELSKLLADAGIPRFEIQAFIQESGPSRFWEFFSPLIPPTRFLVRISGQDRAKLEENISLAASA